MSTIWAKSSFVIRVSGTAEPMPTIRQPTPIHDAAWGLAEAASIEDLPGLSLCRTEPTGMKPVLKEPALGGK